ncbi:MAG: response regulator transcription factor [Anaerolineales bacterium]
MLIDDNRDVRRSLNLFLGTFAEFEVVALAASGPQAVALARWHHPDVALLDMHMPGMDGYATLRALRAACPTLAVVMLTGMADDEQVRRCLSGGAAHFVRKNAPVQVLVSAIRQSVPSA